MKGEDFMEKATVVINDSDRLVSEAFRSLYAGLRLKEESKGAKCLLVTSTLPGEGKSFIVSNLALAFAAHGERTLIIDCDLRRPSVHRVFGLENKRGLIDVVAGRAPPRMSSSAVSSQPRCPADRRPGAQSDPDYQRPGA